MKHNRLLGILIFIPTVIVCLFTICVFIINTFLIAYPIRRVFGIKTSLTIEWENCIGFAQEIFDI